MIRCFTLSLPTTLFDNGNNKVETLLEKEKMGRRLDTLSVIDWCQTTGWQKDKNEQQSANNSSFITQKPLSIMSNEQLLSYNEALWFSLVDLKKIFSVIQIKNAMRYCEGQSVASYSALCRRFNRYENGEDEDEDERIAINMKEMKNNFIHYKPKAFQAINNDRFIKESAFYILLARLRKTKQRPLPDKFLLWIYDKIVPTIRMYTRLSLLHKKEKKGCRPTARRLQCCTEINKIADQRTIDLSDDDSEVMIIGATRDNGTVQQNRSPSPVIVSPAQGIQQGKLNGRNE